MGTYIGRSCEDYSEFGTKNAFCWLHQNDLGVTADRACYQCGACTRRYPTSSSNATPTRPSNNATFRNNSTTSYIPPPSGGCSGVCIILVVIGVLLVLSAIGFAVWYFVARGDTGNQAENIWI